MNTLSAKDIEWARWIAKDTAQYLAHAAAIYAVAIGAWWTLVA